MTPSVRAARGRGSAGRARKPVSPNVDTAADELYGLAREEFTEARDERVRQAREAGDEAAASGIAKLRKPSTAAWVINLFVRERRAEVDRLVELGNSLREAHARLEGDALRELSKQRHQLVRAVVAEAQALARSKGVRAGEPVRRELEDVFTAVLADREAAERVRAGHLSTTRDLVDPEVLSGALARPGAAPPPAKPRPQQQRRPVDDIARRRVERIERLRGELASAAAEAEHADAEAQRARAALEHAEHQFGRASESVVDLQERLTRAQRAEQEANRRLGEARQGHQVAERDAARAHRAVREIEERLSRLE